jgi:ComF family protein
MHVRQAMCSLCAQKIMPIVSFDSYCGKGKYARIFAVSAYQEPLRSFILAKHYHNQAHIVLLADFIVRYLDMLDDVDFDSIVPVPLHWTRYAARGFNQADIIAQSISKVMGKPVIPAVCRSKKTAYQASLSVGQREKNVAQAFSLNNEYRNFIEGKKILIVDDLFTTGSTIKSIASVLHEAGAASVDVFVVCRVVSL